MSSVWNLMSLTFCYQKWHCLGYSVTICRRKQFESHLHWYLSEWAHPGITHRMITFQNTLQTSVFLNRQKRKCFKKILRSSEKNYKTRVSEKSRRMRITNRLLWLVGVIRIIRSYKTKVPVFNRTASIGEMRGKNKYRPLTFDFEKEVLWGAF